MINDSRSMNDDFTIGSADGSVKSLAPDRGGSLNSAPEVVDRERKLRNLYPADQPWPLNPRC